MISFFGCALILTVRAAASPDEQTIRIDPDSGYAVVLGSITANQRVGYAVHFDTGARTVIRLISFDSPLDFAFLLPSKSSALAPTLSGPKGRCQDYANLPLSGDYVIALSTGNGRYELRVGVEGPHELAKCPPDSYVSPDGALRAENDNCGDPLSEVSIARPDETTIYRRQCPTVLLGQGWPIENASWTPDSRYFVFSTMSSGGHGPWHAPTYFYSRGDNKIYSLDDRIGLVAETSASPSFSLSSPDIIHLRLYNDGDPIDYKGSLREIEIRNARNP